MAFDCDAFEQSAFENDCAAAAVVAETLSGGWRRRGSGHWPREESDEARQARIKAERVRMGILPPDPTPAQPPPLPAGEGAGLRAPERPSGATARLGLPDYRGLEERAAGAATRTLDGVIDAQLAALAADEAMAAAREAELVRLLRLDEWLRDEDDATVLMLAIGALH